VFNNYSKNESVKVKEAQRTFDEVDTKVILRKNMRISF
jgi:hypothetical protein